MITDLKEVKDWLRVEVDEDDNLLSSLILASERYIRNAIGRDLNGTDPLEFVAVCYMVSHLYENRSLADSSKKIEPPHGFTAILQQLQYINIDETHISQ